MDRSRLEVEAIVADYLQMLTLELAVQSHNKTTHRENLKQKLQGRSDSLIEFKHANISAAMLDLGFPPIHGYKPRSNYQALVASVLVEQIRGQTMLDSAALAAVQQPAVMPTDTDLAKVKSDAPTKQNRVSEPMNPLLFIAVKRDHLEREAQNQSLGLAGEEFIVQFEHWRLNALGAHKLADKVDHVSKSRGDGLGCDVLSFDADGKERFFEVKTTTFGQATPFLSRAANLLCQRMCTSNFIYIYFSSLEKRLDFLI